MFHMALLCGKYSTSVFLPKNYYTLALVHFTVLFEIKATIRSYRIQVLFVGYEFLR